VNLSKTVLVAPFSGLVSNVSTEVGEFITPSPPGVPLPPVMEIIDTSSLYVTAPFDELDLTKIRPGLRARVTLGSRPGESYAGRVTRLAPIVREVQGMQRTFEIDVELSDAKVRTRLMPGASADVTVVLAEEDEVLRIPTRALIQGDHVFVVDDAGQIQSIPVSTGLSSWEFTEIRSGLDAGMPVVVSLDRAEVRPGVTVVVEAETDQ
jgi:HlyD family secretion protein